ncbi:hypothetical protein [Paenibacillus chitinolyticus]
MMYLMALQSQNNPFGKCCQLSFVFASTGSNDSRCPGIFGGPENNAASTRKKMIAH